MNHSKTNTPLVTVIITAYNDGDCVSQAIESVLAQSYPNFELIVVDDGSTDDTDKAVEAFGKAVRYINQPHTGLPAAARNNGIRNSSGDFIAFLDADDTWELKKLERQVAVARKRPQVGLVCANAYHWKNPAQTSNLSKYLRRGLGHSGAVLPFLLRNNYVITSTAFVRKSLLEQTGLFSEAPELRAIEDYDLWLRIAAVSDIHYLTVPLATYRDFGPSIRDERPYEAHLRGMILILERLQDKFPEALVGLEKIRDSQIAAFERQLASD